MNYLTVRHYKTELDKNSFLIKLATFSKKTSTCTICGSTKKELPALIFESSDKKKKIARKDFSIEFIDEKKFKIIDENNSFLRYFCLVAFFLSPLLLLLGITFFFLFFNLIWGITLLGFSGLFFAVAYVIEFVNKDYLIFDRISKILIKDFYCKRLRK